MKLWLAAFACECIARPGNPRVQDAYMAITLLLMTLPSLCLVWMVRKVYAWERLRELEEESSKHDIRQGFTPTDLIR